MSFVCRKLSSYIPNDKEKYLVYLFRRGIDFGRKKKDNPIGIWLSIGSEVDGLVNNVFTIEIKQMFDLRTDEIYDVKKIMCQGDRQYSSTTNRLSYTLRCTRAFARN